MSGLRETVTALLAELPMSDDGTGHVEACGYTFDEPECGCYTLPARLERIVAARMEQAWDEGFDTGERDVFEHETFDEPCIRNPYRKEANRG